MADDIKYLIRRKIMELIKAQDPAPTTIEEILDYSFFSMRVTPAAAVVDECIGLVEHGYLCNCKPGREPLLRLTAKGRDQVDRETDLDEYIWGSNASKFYKQQ